MSEILSASGRLDSADQSGPMLAVPSSSIAPHEIAGLIVGLCVMGLSDLGELSTAEGRLLAACLVLLVLSPAVFLFWRSVTGFHVVMLWAVLSLSNLLSPLRNSYSALDLAATFVSIVTVVRAAQILSYRRLRHLLTTYVTAVLVLVTAVRGLRALAQGGFRLASLKVDSSAAGMWKGIVLISPCPTQRLSGRAAFLAFKLWLVLLMLDVDRPKIGVLLSVVAALSLGAVIVLLYRSAGTRNVVLACLSVVPFAIGPALIASNRLVQVYGRRTDFSGRTVLWRATVKELWNINPVTGVGFRNALTSSDSVTVVLARFGRDLGNNAVHDVYLQLVAEFGVVGLGLVIFGLTSTTVAVLVARPLSTQVRFAIDAVFVAGICVSEPVLEPSTAIFTLGCLILLQARAIVRARHQSTMPATNAPSLH